MRTSIIINNLAAVKRKVTGQTIPNQQTNLLSPQGIDVIGDQKLLARVKLYQMRIEMNVDNAKISREGTISPVLFNALAEHMNKNLVQGDERKVVANHNEVNRIEMIRVLEYAGALPQKEFLKILLQTQPLTFDTAANNQWNQIETEIINNASLAATVTVYKQDLTKNKSSEDIPFQAQVLFTSPNFEPAKFSPSEMEKKFEGEKDQAAAFADAANARAAMDSRLEAYFNQRVLPLLTHANHVAGENQKKALLALPAFIFTEFKETLGQAYDQNALNALIRMVDKEASKLPNVQGIFLEMQGKPEKTLAGHVAILMQTDYPQVKTLSHPSEYGNDFKHCQLFKVIEGNPFKLGVEQWQPTSVDDSKVDLEQEEIIQRRNRSYAVIQHATNFLALATSSVAEGHFNPTSSRFEPIAKNGTPVADWNDLIQKTKPSITIGSVQELKGDVPLVQSEQIATLAAKNFNADLNSKKQDRSLTGQSKDKLHTILNTFEALSKRLATYFNAENKPEVKLTTAEKNRTFLALTEFYHDIRQDMNDKIQELKQSLQQKINPSAGTKEKVNPLYEGKVNPLHEPPRQRS